jgi:heat-inducible transcriptional repressor
MTPGPRSALDDRKAAILRAIVSHYIRSGDPVGSKTIAEGFPRKVSPATVRNEMAALEEFGLIFQPHTSAGRVPTDAGYRYYVDEWVGGSKLSPPESRRVKTFFGSPRWELEDALRRTASLLSDLTDHAAVVFAPSLDLSVVRHLELVELGGDRAMLVVVTNTGRVENHVVLIGETMDDVQLDQAAEMLNRLVAGVALERVPSAIIQHLDRFPLELKPTVESVARTMQEEVTGDETDRVYLDGTSNIVDEQKFADLESVRQVIGALEHRRVLLELVADAIAVERVSVRIGSENQLLQMQNCTVITTAYGVEGEAIGSLGVVGPTRMDYNRTIAVVYEVAEHLGRMLTGPSL